MKYNDFNSGEFTVGKKRGNRFVSSSMIDDERKSSIAVIAAILVLAILTCSIFVVFSEEFSFPVWNLGGDITTTTKPDAPIIDPNGDYPYATKTNKTQFVANKGGTKIEGIGLNSDYAILINTGDMSTVAHKNADEAIYPASMTKVMTVITALDIIEDLDDVYVLTLKVLNQVPHNASVADLGYLFKNYGVKNVTVRDLLYGIAYKSGADAVLCLMDYLGLSVEQFVALMNQKAKDIGLKSTRFGGVIGMDSEENQTTCREMAAIMTYAMENEYAREFFSGGKYPFDLNDGFSYYHSTLDTLLGKMNTNSKTLLRNYTVIAAKSGLETNAGYCLVSYIKNNTTGEYFVLVTAKAEKYDAYTPAANPINDMVKIFGNFNP